MMTAYVTSPVAITRDEKETSGLTGFTTQPMDEAVQELDPHGNTEEPS